MYFQTLDDKGECVGIYKNGKLYFKDLPDGLERTWKYANYLEKSSVEYASIYCGNRNLNDACPPYLIDDWIEVEAKLKAHYRSFVLAKVNMEENCFFDLVPESYLLDYCNIRNQITQYVFENFEKPENYDFLADLTKILAQISHQKLNIDPSRMDNPADIMRYTDISPYCRYNIAGTKTGRLATERGSFPILTMRKEHRTVIKPTNDFFVELDFNAAELRTLMALGDSPLPLEDIHAWNSTHLMPVGTTRSEAKQRLFSWLYDEEKENKAFSAVYERDKVRSKYWDGEKVKTIFGKVIEADRKHALSYIVQSTTAELVLRQMIEVHKKLEGKQSFIAFTIHDNIVLDIPYEERYIIPEMIEVFSNTPLGKFLINVKAGRDFGNLRELNL